MASKLSEVMSEAQQEILAAKIKKMKCVGYGSITIKIEKGVIKFFIEQTSYEVDVSTSV